MTVAMNDTNRKVLEAIGNKEIPHIYANGMSIVSTASDMTLALHLGKDDVAVVWMTHAVAKTLADGLSRQIAVNEAVLGAPILTLDELDKLRTAYELNVLGAGNDET